MYGSYGSPEPQAKSYNFGTPGISSGAFPTSPNREIRKSEGKSYGSGEKNLADSTVYGDNVSGVHGPSSNDFSRERTKRTLERVSASRGQVGFFTNLIDEDGAEFLSRRVLQFYDADKNGQIDLEEVKKIMKDTYKIIGRNFEPTEQDIKEFYNVLDKNSDGLVTAEDIETCALKYLKTDHYKR